MKKWLWLSTIFLLFFSISGCAPSQREAAKEPSAKTTAAAEIADTRPDSPDISAPSPASNIPDSPDVSDASNLTDIPEAAVTDAAADTDREEADTDDESDDAKRETEEKRQEQETEQNDGLLPALEEDGSYTSKEDVALYIHLYGHLPSNFITKKEAERLGWPGGSLEPYAPGKCIGGSRFGNYEGLLPEKDGRTYTECDIDTLGAEKRGAKRIVFSNDGLIYYTEDHYETFELLYGEETSD